MTTKNTTNMRIYLKTHFDASHKLYLPYKSGCVNSHGHRWNVEIFCNGQLNKEGMVVDFKKLKKIINKFDHEDLNKFFKQPTAENISINTKDKILKKFKNVDSCSIRVWETPDSYAEVRGLSDET
jgi:6-pyruvoyltetrahydropterin/6-carboxytetrahydropterin synthase